MNFSFLFPQKSLYIPYIHVGAMSQQPQPGGLKRKHPDDEDEDEDPPSAPDPIRRPPPRTLTKQEMLNLTQCKLEKVKYTPNSSLCQYVVMLNTARTLEQELLREGVRLWPTGANFIPAVNHQVPFDPTRPPPPDDARTNLNNLEDVVTSVSYTSSYTMDTSARTSTTSVINTSVAPSDIFGGVSCSTTHSSEYDRYLLDLDGPSSGRATPFVRSDVESCALWNEDSDRLTSLNWSSVLCSVDVGNPIVASSFYSETTIESSATSCNFDASSNSSSGCSSDCSMSDDAMSSSETSLHTLMPVTTGIPTGLNSVCASSNTSASSSPRVTSALGSSSSQSGSSPPNSEDEIFGDIDLALYDYDFTPLSPPNVRMAPVSAEELMQSLSSDQRVDNIEYLTSVRT